MLAAFVRALDVLVGEGAVAFGGFAHGEQREAGHLRDGGGDDDAAEFRAGDEVGIDLG